MKRRLQKIVNKFLNWLFGIKIKDGVIYAKDFSEKIENLENKE